MVGWLGGWVVGDMRKTFLWFALATLMIVGVAFVPSSRARGEGTTHYAGLVIDFDDGQAPRKHCVDFTEDSITGYELLERAGVDFVAAFDNSGAAICAIDDVGCPPDSCLTCHIPNYWSYWYLEGGAWVYSNIGSSLRQVTDGAVQGWIWGNGSNSPPVIPLDQICDLSTPTETATATATATPTQTPTATPTDAPAATPTTKPATATPSIMPPTVTWTPDIPTPTPQPYVRFWIDEDTIQAGTCTTLRWQTDHVKAVLLNGRGMPGLGAQQVCPCENKTYTLHVVYSNEASEDFSIPLYVLGECTTPTPTWTPELAATDTPRPTEPVYVMPTATPEGADALLPTATAPPPETANEAPTATPEPLATPSPEPLPSPTSALAYPTPQPQPVTQPVLAPTATRALPTRPSDLMGAEENSTSSRDALRTGYLVFGALLIGIGGGYIFMQRQRGA